MKTSKCLGAICLSIFLTLPSLLHAQSTSNNSQPTAAVPASVAVPVLPPPASPVSSEYIIGPENSITIDIYYGKDQHITQKVRVSSEGDITCPLIGAVRAEGLTVTQLQQKLTDMLGKDYLVNPQVTVYIEEYSTVSVIGQVSKPGSYPIKGKLTVIEAISLAEGFTKIAAPNGVKVVRRNPDGTTQEIMVKVYDIMNKNADVKNDIVLKSGDVVVVPESVF